MTDRTYRRSRWMIAGLLAIAGLTLAAGSPLTEIAGPDRTRTGGGDIVQMLDTADDGDVERRRTDGLNGAGHFEEVRVAADGTRHLIPLEAVEWGGVARDGIPALDTPAYVGPERWAQMVYDPDGLVVGVEVDGRQRAYPLQILIWHEIINETFEGKHLLVTY